MHRLYISLLFASTLMFVVAHDCLAEGFAVDTNTLPKVVPYTHRKQIQIIKTSPDITDVRPGMRPVNTYIIPIPAQKIPQGNQYILPVNGGSGGVTPAAVFVDDGSLPAAQFESNMDSLNSRRNSLPTTKMGGVPTATVKKGVTGRMNPASKTGPRQIKPVVGQPQTMSYERSSSGSAMNTSTTKTKVKGVVKTDFKRGFILNKGK